MLFWFPEGLLSRIVKKKCWQDDIDNLMNDSNTEFIAEEEITQSASTQDTSLTTPEANLLVVPSDN